MTNPKPTDTKGNLVFSTDPRSAQISFKLSEADKVRFDQIVASTGDDNTSVLREMVKAHIAKSRPELERDAVARKRADLHAHIVHQLRWYVQQVRDIPDALSALETQLHLRAGTLEELIKEEDTTTR